jgi:hypothetical protein
MTMAPACQGSPLGGELGARRTHLRNADGLAPFGVCIAGIGLS